jgi:hypothetical protein
MSGNKKYTVIGYYLDNNQPFMDWVEARDPKSAVRKARKFRSDHALGIVEVIKGNHKGCLSNETVLY